MANGTMAGLDVVMVRPCSSIETASPGGLKVPFAIKGNGRIAHVTHVTSKDEGPFTCPQCRGGLILRQPRDKRRHFAHASDAPCSGETALHLYAKEVLLREKTLSIPELSLKLDGLRERVCGAHPDFRFDRVELEVRKDGFQPDAIGYLGAKPLGIEFRVWHEVDEEKRARVRASDLSMIEIDLHQRDVPIFDADALDDFILHQAPRRWIHHRKEAATRGRLKARVEQRRKDELRRFRAHLQYRAGPTHDRLRHHAQTMEGIQQAGLSDCVGLQTRHLHWFTVEPEIWQAHLVDKLIVSPAQRFSPGYQALRIDFREISMPEDLRRLDLLDRRPFPKGVEEEVGSENSALWAYLYALYELGGVLGWASERKAFFVNDELHGRLFRTRDMRVMVLALLRMAGASDPDLALSNWWQNPFENGPSPEILARKGGPEFQALDRRIKMIAHMSRGYPQEITTDLCDLPLEPILEAAQERLRQAEEKRLEDERVAEKEAADWRQLQLREAAGARLGDAAWVWMETFIDGATPTSLARQSEDGMRQSMQRLKDEIQRRQHLHNVARREASIRQLADRAFRDTSHRDLFLRSSHPRLGGRRPIEMVESDAEVELVKTVLPPLR